MATSFRLLPPEDPTNPDEPLKFRCGDCKEAFLSGELETHAAKRHRAGSISVDTTLPKDVVDIRKKDAVLGYNIHNSKKRS